MKLRLNFRPDLADSVLEGRSLMDASQVGIPPVALTAGGFFVLPLPSANFSSSLGTLSGVFGVGGPGSTGMGVASSFYIAGFGLSTLTMGNGTGFPLPSPGGQAGTGVTPIVNITVGSGANEAGPATIVSRNVLAQSTLLLPGTGFLYIGKTFGSGSVAPAPTTTTTPTGPPGTRAPVAPVAPMGPTAPAAPGRGGPLTPGAAGSPRGPGAPTPTSGGPSLSGAVPSLRGTPTSGLGPLR